MSHAFLEVDGLSKVYPDGRGGELTVFEDVRFSLEKGEFVCVIGHSGCGKSTILNVLAGLDKASAGNVVMNGKEVTGPGLERGVVFQNYSLLPWKTALRNVIFAVQARWPGLVPGPSADPQRALPPHGGPGACHAPKAVPVIRGHAPTGEHRPRLRHSAGAVVAG